MSSAAGALHMQRFRNRCKTLGAWGADVDARAVKAIEERLPQLAHSKLRDFTLARDLALDASRSANARLNALPRDADQQMRERLASEQGRQNRRHGQLHALLSKVQQWLSELPATVALQPVPPVSVELKP